MQQQTTQLARVRPSSVPFVVDINMRPSDVTQDRRRRAAGGRVGRVHLHAREPRAAPARQPAVLRPRPARCVAEYLDLRRASPSASPQQPQARRPRRVAATRSLGGRLQRDAPDLRGQGARHQPRHPASSSRRSAPTASSSRSRARATSSIGTERIYDDKLRHRRRPSALRRPRPAVDRRRPARLPARAGQAQRAVPVLRHDRPLPDGLAVRLHLPLPQGPGGAQRSRSWSSSSTPPTPRRPGSRTATGPRSRNQFSRCEGVVNVSDEVPARADLGDLRLAGPERRQPVRRCRSTTPTTSSPAATLQQKSNGAFFKNTRGALRKLDRAPRTAANTPGAVREGPLRPRHRPGARPATPTPRPRTSSRARSPDEPAWR